MTAEPDTLAEALGLCGIELPADKIERLDAYRTLLWDWNTKLNLTRHTTLEKFASRDIVDTLELSKLIPNRARVLDVGSGGGVPGLVLAIVRPDLRLSVCDSVQKKSKVLEAITAELGLPARVFAARVQEVLEVSTYDTLVARAVAPLSKLLTLLAPHWDSFDQLLLIKGRSWADERGEARHLGLLTGKELRKAAEYTTPRTDAVSVVLRIWPEGRELPDEAEEA
ncbi:Ribosomal RNA small subunit methyltransferase G [Pirellulimonas nuda]|uniref:Ribosomal RNA small subunit methyltransferase G n=1 Tax=Pirellulimonas nuda TaxID=2528009 RepID=A0A518DI29_9BACT|nr:16S rRNA (guanine(527)-N(7))-methyltransferase RsmG [Pirellulimonas nuda]QDU91052.1 Ribosomal RNA small subunit methyltransferase G [Pirellulimonas nuda]